MFCPKCKELMNLGTNELICSCGFTTKKGNVIEKITNNSQIAIHDGKNIFAIHEHDCPKCHHDKAQMIELGVWYNDEDMDIMYKCGKCGFCERDDETKTT
jgi:DNA-directed RNA polymerase subunit M/transcription elongation factor TFIIS